MDGLGIKGKIPIYGIRNEKVIFEKDAAEIYGVKTKVLRKKVLINRARFPYDFMFRLTDEELKVLNSRSEEKKKVDKSFPYVFTERGLSMISCVLETELAVKVSIQVVRSFVH
ncbi:MAG: ORF6N domain-containing protein [Endomicrobiales bacterium]|nr:ORF6N domain-containing protein [Endomicrobiales bacterium]